MGFRAGTKVGRLPQQVPLSTEYPHWSLVWYVLHISSYQLIFVPDTVSTHLLTIIYLTRVNDSKLWMLKSQCLVLCANFEAETYFLGDSLWGFYWNCGTLWQNEPLELSFTSQKDSQVDFLTSRPLVSSVARTGFIFKFCQKQIHSLTVCLGFTIKTAFVMSM